MRFPIVRATLLFAAVILGGLLLFFFDLYEVGNTSFNTVLLLAFLLLKAAYFVRALLGWIRKSVVSAYHLTYMTGFFVVHVLLLVLSFGIDYYCLHRISPASFALPDGQASGWAQLLTFIYFSLGKFTTAGGGELHPATAVAQCCAMAEMALSYFTTVLVIANVGYLQALFRGKADEQPPT